MNKILQDFTKGKYKKLNAKQQENFNFHKIAGILADYGFNSIRLYDDWKGADFLAYHNDEDSTLRIQLKGRWTIEKKYVGKEIYIAFPNGDDWYLYPHDELIDYFKREEKHTVLETPSWKNDKKYGSPSISNTMKDFFDEYKI